MQRKRNRAPVIGGGILGWSGLYEYMLTAVHIVDMAVYVRTTAHKLGQHDGEFNRIVDSNFDNPFHPEFLSGQPYLMWRREYLNGCVAGRSWLKNKKLNDV